MSSVPHTLREVVSSGSFRSLDLGPDLEPRLVSLDSSFIDQVCALEPWCYPNPWSETLIRAEFVNDVSLRLGLEIRGSLVAYSFNYLLVDELHVLNLAVVPELQGCGLARRLLCRILCHAINYGAVKASLEVRPSNSRALALYRRLEFKSIAVRESYYRDNGEDALLLERHLSREDLPLFEQTGVYEANGTFESSLT